MRAATAATLGPASGFVGSMLAMEIVHDLTGLCRPATRDCAVLVDLDSLEIRREPIQRHPAGACGQR